MRHILYLFVFLLAYGNGVHSVSASGTHPFAVNERIEQYHFGFIDNADVADLITEAFTCIEEEYPTQDNDDSNDDGKVFDGDHGLPFQQTALSADLHAVSASALPSGAPAAHSAPLYLLHRVFRI